jgi:hypothetical protein
VRVDWVHPSWRDVVIEALARDPGERRRFLARCGVNGAAVALATAGGATGERIRPLLIEDADWDALADGLHRLCGELDEADAARLLTILAATEPDPETSALTALVARRLAVQWQGRVLAVDTLEAWAAVVSRLPERPGAPLAAAATWTSLAPHGVPATPEALERFADWLRLAELLREHDPALLAGLGFPDRYETIMLEFAESVPRDEPPAEQELRLQALELLAGLDPVCTGQAMNAAAAMREDDWTLEFPPLPAPDGFPVQRVLRDLID